jgi:hypothetical protein
MVHTSASTLIPQQRIERIEVRQEVYRRMIFDNKSEKQRGELEAA